MPLRLSKIAFPMPLSIALAIQVAMLLSLASWSQGSDGENVIRRVIFLPVNAALRAEVADTDAARAKGLMHRAHLGKNEGMIFYFDAPGYHAFYMYNTRIPLSVIFLNENLRIVDIKDMAPCKEQDPSDCPVYRPRAACKYAIEVNQEFIRKHRIKRGDLIRIEK
jgi:uncharacterized membrane protein (UPF0127 family)